MGKGCGLGPSQRALQDVQRAAILESTERARSTPKSEFLSFISSSSLRNSVSSGAVTFRQMTNIS